MGKRTVQCVVACWLGMASLTAHGAHAEMTRSDVVTDRTALDTVQTTGELVNPDLPGPDDNPLPDGNPYYTLTGYVCNLQYVPTKHLGQDGLIGFRLAADPSCEQPYDNPEGYIHICSAYLLQGCPSEEQYHYDAFALQMMFASLHRAMLAGQLIHVTKEDNGNNMFHPTLAMTFKLVQ